MNVNERIREIREERGFTQQTIAEQIFVGQRTYSDYESGKTRIPVDRLLLLARFYDVSLDYLTGAAMSRGGKAFLCMTSTYREKDGTIRSRIVPTFQGDIITDPRSQAYYMVTEYGMVNLVGRSTWERAELLISIAHPDFREELIRKAEDNRIWIRSNKR